MAHDHQVGFLEECFRDEADEGNEIRRLLRAHHALLERVLRLEAAVDADRRHAIHQFAKIHTALEKILAVLHKLTDVPVVRSLNIHAGDPR